MKEDKESVQRHPEELEDLDEAFDAALAELSDANAKVTEVLETMDEPDTVSAGVDMDADGNTVEGDDSAEDADASKSEASEA